MFSQVSLILLGNGREGRWSVIPILVLRGEVCPVIILPGWGYIMSWSCQWEVDMGEERGYPDKVTLPTSPFYPLLGLVWTVKEGEGKGKGYHNQVILPSTTLLPVLI